MNNYMNYNGLNPFQQYQPQYNMPATQYGPKQEVIRVNGENGARAYQMAPNSSVLLLDESAPIIWLKSTDGAGYPSITQYSITPYQEQEPVDIKTLEERISRLEEIYNAKSNNSGTQRNEKYEQRNANGKPN